MSTLSELYLDSEPVGVSVEVDQLVVTFANGSTCSIPLSLVSELAQQTLLPATAEILILRRPPRIDHVHVTDISLNVYLQDGRMLSNPLAWFPRLLHGTGAERNHYVLSGEDSVIHWPELDEDIELLRLFEGGKSIEKERALQGWLESRQAKVVS